MGDSKSRKPSQLEKKPGERLPTAEFLTLAGAAAAATGAASLGQQAHHLFSPAAPLLVYVLASELTMDEHHLVEFGIRNTTPHGIYLERMEMFKPKEIPLRVKRSRLGMGEDSGTFPFWIEPEGYSSFKMLIPELDRSRFGREPWGQARITYSKLDEKKEAKVDFVFRLRWR